MTLSTAQIEHGQIREEHRGDLARIVYEAFEAKISAMGMRQDAALGIIAGAIQADAGFLAYREGCLVGVAGVVTRDSRFLRFRFRDLWRYLGPFKAVAYYPLLGVEDHVARGECKISPLAISPEARGQGIGTALMGRVEAFARQRGYAFLSLEVVDTNVGAQRLYRRMGFEVISEMPLGGLAHRAGFNGALYMRKWVDPSSRLAGANRRGRPH
jgi:ribosomal protein S18 acetylase RimI-like enzyme